VEGGADKTSGRRGGRRRGGRRRGGRRRGGGGKEGATGVIDQPNLQLLKICSESFLL